jgi:hypothetical protein
MGVEYVLGKKCKIVIVVDGKKLFYTVKKVIDISKNHISFVDKFGKTYTYSLEYLKEIHSIGMKA